MSLNRDHLKTIAGVDIFCWKPPREDGSADVADKPEARLNNFGDLLGPLVVQQVLSQNSQQASPSPSTKTVFTVGSVLHFANTADIIWGSGVNGKVSNREITRNNRLDIRAVRGHWTARFLSGRGYTVPSIFGDPALLLPRLMPDLRTQANSKHHGTIFVPNLNDTTIPVPAGVEVISPLGDPVEIIHEIITSEFVTSTSLHAVVVADAFGIPARFVVSQHEHPFKYRDYLSGTGRPRTRISSTVEEALLLGAHEPAEFDEQLLLDAFPWDAWGISRWQVATELVPAFRSSEMVRSAWMRTVAPRPTIELDEIALCRDRVCLSLNEAFDRGTALTATTAITTAREFDECFPTWPPASSGIGEDEMSPATPAELSWMRYKSRSRVTQLLVNGHQCVGSMHILTFILIRNDEDSAQTLENVAIDLVDADGVLVYHADLNAFRIQEHQWYRDFDVVLTAEEFVQLGDMWEVRALVSTENETREFKARHLAQRIDIASAASFSGRLSYSSTETGETP